RGEQHMPDPGRGHAEIGRAARRRRPELEPARMNTSQIAEPPTAAESPDGRDEVIELDVTGMSCGSCVARVQGALGAAPGVAEATVNFATGRATVDVASESTDLQQLVEVVERIGYGAKPV